MSSNTLKRLFIVFVALLLLLGAGRFFSGLSFRRQTVGDPVFRRFDVNAVEQMDLMKGDERVYLARQDGRWVVHSRFDFPADFPTVARALQALDQLKIGRVVPDGADFLSDFGLDPRAEEDPPLILVFRRQRGREMARVFIGNHQTSAARGPWAGLPSGRFLRVDDGPVMLVNQRLDEFSMDPDDWIRRELIGVPASEVASIIAAPLGSDPYEIQVQEDGRYLVTDLLPGEDTNQSGAGRVARSLQNLRSITVVDPDVRDAERGFDDPSKLRIVTQRGIVYSLRIGGPSETDEGHYVRIAVSLDPKFVAGDPDEETRLATLRSILHGWTFLIPSFQVDAMRLPRDQVVTSPAPEPEATPAPGADFESETGIEPWPQPVPMSDAPAMEFAVPEEIAAPIQPPAPPVVEMEPEAMPQIDVQIALPEDTEEADVEETPDQEDATEPARPSFDLGAPRPAHIPPRPAGPRRDLEP